MTIPVAQSFGLLIDGKELAATDLAYVTSVKVDESVDAPSMCTIELFGADTLSEPLPWVDDKRFEIGGAIGIEFGEGEHGDKKEAVFSGEIAGLEPEFAFNRLPSLTVRGFDRRHRLTRRRKSQTFLKKKDSDIAVEVAESAGLTASAMDSKVTHEHVYQIDQTDWDFLLERARRIEFEIAAGNEKDLEFRPVANAEGEALSLRFPETLSEFFPRLVSSGQVTEVTVRAWNVKDKKAFVAKVETGVENCKMGGAQSGGQLVKDKFKGAVEIIARLPVATQAEADQIAKGRLNHLALGFITAEGVCEGRTDLRAGKVVKIEGLGKRFSGLYYVVSTIHRYTRDRGYQTYFTVRRNAS